MCDSGRPIDRDPRALAQRILSIAAAAGDAGVAIADLGEQLPAFSAEEIDAALELLRSSGNVDGDHVRTCGP